MPCCYICGEEGKDFWFVLSKRFLRYHPKEVQWCYSCQLMYVNMMKQKFREMVPVDQEEEESKQFLVSFK